LLSAEFARAAAGNDDAAFVQLFTAMVNISDPIEKAPPSQRAEAAMRALNRSSRSVPAGATVGLRSLGGGGPAEVRDTIWADELFVENSRRVIDDRLRLIGAEPTAEFPDCVAVGSDRGWCCTGALVAPNLVITAAHCAPDCSARVFVGNNVDDATAGTAYSVADAHVHPEYRGRQSDVLGLVLNDEIQGVEPRAIADPDLLANMRSVRLVGFGTTDVWGLGGYGQKRVVDVPVASSDPRFGADPQVEFVAGAPFLDRDSCKGDSGGPAYVSDGVGWRLAGATSRATDSAVRTCGDGGIYTRVAAFLDWMRSLPGVRWT